MPHRQAASAERRVRPYPSEARPATHFAAARSPGRRRPREPPASRSQGGGPGRWRRSPQTPSSVGIRPGGASADTTLGSVQRFRLRTRLESITDDRPAPGRSRLAFTGTRVRKAFATGSEPNGSVNHFAIENREEESPRRFRAISGHSPRSLVNAPPEGRVRQRDPAPANPTRTCGYGPTPAGSTTAASFTHSAPRIP
jgi:hypothetical protein